MGTVIRFVTKWASDNRYVIGAVLTAVGGAIAGQIDVTAAVGIVLAALSRDKK